MAVAIGTACRTYYGYYDTVGNRRHRCSSCQPPACRLIYYGHTTTSTPTINNTILVGLLPVLSERPARDGMERPAR